MPLPGLVSRNGALIPPSQANVSVFNPALYGAYGVYESLQVVHGVVFEEAAHLARLAHSAEVLDLPLPAPLGVIEGWISQVLAANHVEDCTLRMLLIGADGRSETAAFIWPQPAPVYAADLYRRGAAAITFGGERALPTAKSLNTLVNSLAHRRAAAAGAHEALLYHNGLLTEGSNSNLFAVLEGIVVTPPAEQVLPGVTRDVLIRLMANAGITLREGPLPLASVQEWTECFITSTSRHVMPVTSIDGRPVGMGEPGSLTKRLSGLFEAHFAEVTSATAPAHRARTA